MGTHPCNGGRVLQFIVEFCCRFAQQTIDLRLRQLGSDAYINHSLHLWFFPREPLSADLGSAPEPLGQRDPVPLAEAAADE